MDQAIDIPEQTESGPLIRLRGLYKSFGENHVLKNVELDLNKSECLAVVGRSGSGKSVLIKCIIGLIAPDAGSIHIYGKNIPELSHEELDEVRKQTGFLFQNNALYDSMTVRENLEFALRRHQRDKSKEQIDSLVEEALNNVGLPHTEKMLPAELSGGMSKRIALARTIILRPRVILYDEPTTGLDPITGKEISQLIVDIHNRYHSSAIVISHDLNCVNTVSDRVAMLIDGGIYATATMQELRDSSDSKIKAYFE